MVRSLFAVALALSAGVLAADDKKDDKKPDTKDYGKLIVGKDAFKISAFAEDSGVIATCKYTADKDGLVKAKITKVAVKGDFQNKPPEGLEFTFKWKAKGDTATLDDLTGDGLENAKPVVEGEYERKKK